MGTVKNVEKLVLFLKEKYGHSTVETFYRILEGIPVHSLKKDLLKKIMRSCLIYDENELYEFLKSYFSKPEGSLSDDYKNKYIFEETESTRILQKTPFVPQNDGTWILSGKDLTVFGGLNGLYERGFKKQSGTVTGEKIIVGPDGIKYSVKIVDVPVAKIILKQINEASLLNNVGDELPDEHYTIDLVTDIMINEREILSAYFQANGDLIKTLEILKSYNNSWRKTEENIGRKRTLELIKKIIENKK